MEDQIVISLTRPVFTYRAWQECIWNLRSADTGYFEINVEAFLNSYNYIRIGQSKKGAIDYLFVLRTHRDNYDYIYPLAYQLPDPEILRTTLFYIGKWNGKPVSTPNFHSYVYQSSIVILFQWRNWRWDDLTPLEDGFHISVTHTSCKFIQLRYLYILF